MASTRRFAKIFSATALLSFVAASVLFVGCESEYDLERQQYQRGTLGEELHAIWLKDTERSATQPQERTALLENRRADFISAIDTAVPGAHVVELDEFLLSFLPVVEEGYFPTLTQRIAHLLEEAADDAELMASLDDAPLYGAADFLSLGERGKFLYEATKYEDMPRLISHLGHSLAERDGLSDDGRVVLGQSRAYSNLLRSIADAMESDPPSESADRLATTLRDMLLVADNRYRSGAPSRNTFVALFDDRGLPVVRPTSGGALPAPFVDSNGDGLADVDEEGRFLLDDGRSLAIAPISSEPIDHPALSRDFQGRAEFGPGQLAFRYVDISDTALPFLVRMVGRMADAGVFYNLAVVGLDVLGPSVPDEDPRGIHQAFRQGHPVVDLLDAVISGMAISELADVMDLTARYIDRQVDDLAFLSYAIGDAAQILDDYPQVDISADQTLIHDLLDILREIAAEPQLWADVMVALRDPILERTGDAMLLLLRHRDTQAVPVDGGPYDQCFQVCKNQHQIGTVQRFDCIQGCPNHEIFSELTDFSAPESEQNRSMMQRLFHLLRDTTGAEYVMYIEEAVIPGFNLGDLPPLVALPGAAEAFVRAVAGQLHLSEYISDEFQQSDLGQVLDFLKYIVPGVVDDETVAGVLSIASELFGARLDPQPTPDQITRLFNQQDLRFEEPEEGVVLDVSNPVCNDGFEMASHHADGLFAAEASGLIDVLYPMAVAFSTHDKEELLARLFTIVHDHYSSRTDLYVDVHGQPSPMKGANLVSAEAALEQVFDEGRIFEALRRLAMSTRNLTDDDGVAIDERLRQLIHQWVRNDDGYAPPSGEVVELADGRIVDPPSRLDVILDRAAMMSANIEGDDVALEHLRQAAESFFELALSAEIINGQPRFNEEGTIALATHGLRTLARRARQMQERGEFDDWLHHDLPHAAMTTYTSRGFYAFVELLEALHRDEDDADLLTGLLTHFGESGARADQMSLMVYAVLIQALDLERLMPVGRFVMSALDPDNHEEIGHHFRLPTATVLARVLAMSSDYDPEGHGMGIIGRGSLSQQGREASFPTLSNMVFRYFSSEPDGDGPLSVEARQTALRALASWLVDTHRGLERYFLLIEQRRRAIENQGQ